MYTGTGDTMAKAKDRKQGNASPPAGGVGERSEPEPPAGGGAAAPGPEVDPRPRRRRRPCAF
jgi:hypothetical protein